MSFNPENKPVPERRVASPEERAVFRTFRESISAGSCNSRELKTARQSGKITQEQFALLSIALAEKLETMVEIDPLTRLFNRSFLKPRLSKVMEELNHEGEERRFRVQSVMVIFFDIKDFKKLNDTHGHSAGDKALAIVAQRLKKETRRNDLIFRVGGDEFIAVLPINDKNPRTLQAVFDEKKRKINDALSVEAGAADVPFRVSMGFEILNKGDTTTAEELLAKADRKMYQEKNGAALA